MSIKGWKVRMRASKSPSEVSHNLEMLGTQSPTRRMRPDVKILLIFPSRNFPDLEDVGVNRK